jgi:ribosomal protein S17E
LRVEDSESGEIIKLLPHEVKSAYQKRIADYNEKLVSEFNQNKIDYVPVDTSKSVEEIILPFLMKRKKMR